MEYVARVFALLCWKIDQFLKNRLLVKECFTKQCLSPSIPQCSASSVPAKEKVWCRMNTVLCLFCLITRGDCRIFFISLSVMWQDVYSAYRTKKKCHNSISWWWCWGSNPGCCFCWASSLPLNCIPNPGADFFLTQASIVCPLYSKFWSSYRGSVVLHSPLIVHYLYIHC